MGIISQYNWAWVLTTIEVLSPLDVTMRDSFYADNRDLVKWGVLLRLAEIFEADRILQLAFYRPSEFGRLVIDGQECDIPEDVTTHFRNVKAIENISSKVGVTVFGPVFENRSTYLQAALAFLSGFAQERCIVFLDPDTGLEPQKPSFDHVLESEAHVIWDEMKARDVFAFYQHQTNRAGKPWIEPKRSQLAGAIGLPLQEIKIANGRSTARDVVFFYAQKA